MGTNTNVLVIARWNTHLCLSHREERGPAKEGSVSDEHRSTRSLDLGRNTCASKCGHNQRREQRMKTTGCE